MKNIILIATIIFTSAFYNVVKGQDTVMIVVNNINKIDVITPPSVAMGLQEDDKKEWQLPFNFSIIRIINNSGEKIQGIEIKPFTGRSILKINNDTTRRVIDFDVRADVKRDAQNWQKTNQLKLEIIYSKNGEPENKLIKIYRKDTTASVIKTFDNTVDTAKKARRYPFYDALLLHNMLKGGGINPKDTNQLKEILSTYAGVPNSFTLGELRYIYKNNSFINEYLLRGIAMAEFGRFQNFEDISDNKSGNSKPVLTRLGSTIGGLNATVFADAFAKIIVKRFKQDLNELFFEKMKEDMAETVELTTLFPRTYGLLSQIDTEIYGFDKYIESLRQKIEEDLGNTLANTNAFLETEKYKSAFDGNQPVRGFIMTVTQFADGLVQNDHPGVSLENLNFSEAYDETDEGKTLKGSLQTIRLLSMGLQDSIHRSSSYWISGLDSLYLLFKGKDMGAAKIWLGLMHELAVDEDDPSVFIRYNDSTTLRDYINYLNTPSEDPFYDRAQDFIRGLMQKVNDIERSYKALNDTRKQNEDGKVYWEQLVGFYENAVGLVKYAPKLQEVFDKNAAMPYNWHRGIFIAETLPRIYAEMKARQYHSAISHVTELMKAADFRQVYLYNKKFDPTKDINLNKQVLYQRIVKKKKTDKEKYAPLREYAPIFGKYIKVSKSEYRLIDSIFIFKKDEKMLSVVDYVAIDNFFKYGNFAAALVLAKTSDEVQALLEATMSPLGSSRIKESGVVFGINSYLGFQGAIVHNKGLVSVSAPIGINMSINRLWKPKHRLIKESHFGKKIAPRNAQLLLSIVDLGGLTRWRLTNNDTTTAPKITVNDIFAPGIYAMLGRFGGTPLNISVGFQTQPLLYRINSATIQYRDNIRFRGSLNLSWDIPFWNITYRKRRNYERRD